VHLHFLQREVHLKTIFSLVLLLIVSTAFAGNLKYYSPNLTAQLNAHSLKNDALKIALFDTISANQTSLGYEGARKVMFGQLYIKSDGSGYFIEDVYCQKKFRSNAGVKPSSIPKSDQINCEHTWPQSKFTHLFPKDLQKADLHHLYPSDSKANSIRGNLDFTDVSQDSGILSEGNCSVSKFGSSVANSDDGFEPPLTHKGNVARSIFYFSVRYKIKMPKHQEEVLRRWNDLDPVDLEEMDHNDSIEKVQGNRNPFIDFPNLTNDIERF
jgi:hypothetical protein